MATAAIKALIANFGPPLPLQKLLFEIDLRSVFSMRSDVKPALDAETDVKPAIKGKPDVCDID